MLVMLFTTLFMLNESVMNLIKKRMKYTRILIKS